jgi:hypothetical protein
MFRERPVFADLSTGQRDPDDWDIGRLRTIDYLLDTRVLTYEPILSLLAVGEISDSISRTELRQFDMLSFKARQVA